MEGDVWVKGDGICTKFVLNLLFSSTYFLPCVYGGRKNNLWSAMKKENYIIRYVRVMAKAMIRILFPVIK